MSESSQAITRVLARPIVAGLVIPVLVMIVDPWRRQSEVPSTVIGAIVAVSGVAMLLRAGGEIASSEPGRLVTGGLFAHSRNPLHLAVLAILAGLSMASRSPILGIYLLAAGIGLHLWVLRWAEPRAEHTFGDRWHHYRSRVPRWFPRPSSALARR